MQSDISDRGSARDAGDRRGVGEPAGRGRLVREGDVGGTEEEPAAQA